MMVVHPAMVWNKWISQKGRAGTGQRFGQFYLNTFPDFVGSDSKLFYEEDDSVAFRMALEMYYNETCNVEND